MFQEDQGMFCRKTQETNQLRGKHLKWKNFEEFWAGIWEDKAKTPQQKWMNTVAKKMGEKLRMCRNSRSRNERIDLLQESTR